MGSILEDIKKQIGFDADYTAFDSDILLLINSEFATLFQAGVGPVDKAFKITGSKESWEEFLGEKTNLESVKEYIYLKVKMVFDPPANSFVMEAYKTKAEELLWRLNIEDDPGWRDEEEETDE